MRNARQLLDRELDADGEQEQDDADLGERLDVLDAIDEPESVRPAKQAGDQEPDDRRQSRAMKHDDDDDAEPEDEQQVLQEVRRSHASDRSCDSPRSGFAKFVLLFGQFGS